MVCSIIFLNKKVVVTKFLFLEKTMKSIPDINTYFSNKPIKPMFFVWIYMYIKRYLFLTCFNSGLKAGLKTIKRNLTFDKNSLSKSVLSVLWLINRLSTLVNAALLMFSILPFMYCTRQDFPWNNICTMVPNSPMHWNQEKRWSKIYPSDGSTLKLKIEQIKEFY